MNYLINAHWVWKNIIPFNNRRKFSDLAADEKSVAYGIILEILFDSIKEELLKNDDHGFSPHNPPRTFSHIERLQCSNCNLNGTSVEITKLETATPNLWVPKHIWIETSNTKDFSSILEEVQKKWQFSVILQKAHEESEICKSPLLPKRVKTLFVISETA